MTMPTSGPTAATGEVECDLRGSGDPEHGPNPSLAPIEKAPFYAIKVLPGSFGTFAGLKADPPVQSPQRGRPTHSRPLRRRQRPSQRDGGHYPSGGINIGPAMTFGYLAARHAAGVDDRADNRP